MKQLARSQRRARSRNIHCLSGVPVRCLKWDEQAFQKKCIALILRALTSTCRDESLVVYFLPQQQQASLTLRIRGRQELPEAAVAG